MFIGILMDMDDWVFRENNSLLPDVGIDRIFYFAFSGLGGKACFRELATESKVFKNDRSKIIEKIFSFNQINAALQFTQNVENCSI